MEDGEEGRRSTVGSAWAVEWAGKNFLIWLGPLRTIWLDPAHPRTLATPVLPAHPPTGAARCYFEDSSPDGDGERAFLRRSWRSTFLFRRLMSKTSRNQRAEAEIGRDRWVPEAPTVVAYEPLPTSIVSTRKLSGRSSSKVEYRRKRYIRLAISPNPELAFC